MAALRIVAVTSTIAVLAWAGYAAVVTARIDGALAKVSAKLAARTGVPASAPEWPLRRRQLEEVAALGWPNPTVHELLGVVALRADHNPDSVKAAAGHFAAALALRPISGYTWANMAGAQYLLGDTTRLFELSLARAADLAPNEPAVQGLVANFGLAVWDEVRPETRAAIERMVAAGMRRNPMEMLLIAERRDRLSTACRHLLGGPRQPDAKGLDLCQRTGA